MTSNNLSLHGRVALVTGASSGIGRAIALAFAQAGASVVINHLANGPAAALLADQIVRLGGRACVVEADVTKSTQLADMVLQVEHAFGPIDVLVNNAGIIDEKPFLDISEQDWNKMLSVDLTSVFLASRAVLPSMIARGHGVIINIASDLGLMGRAHFSAYCAAKAGVIGLTKAMAREFAPAIRVNAIAPGPVNTAMLSLEMMSAQCMAKELDSPQRRIAEPDEIAATALFLASDLARFYCGQVLGPNGGSVMP
ncbi:MAG: 3-oxoacyl-[acyl-carrier protein] reductase [Janthinobacterium sp.]|jgi:3-oxoacyl-[acyl-carrier protein] reductase